MNEMEIMTNKMERCRYYIKILNTTHNFIYNDYDTYYYFMYAVKLLLDDVGQTLIIKGQPFIFDNINFNTNIQLEFSEYYNKMRGI